MATDSAVPITSAKSLLNKGSHRAGAPAAHGGGDGGDNGDMEKRVTQLEASIGRIDQTLAFMRENMATKADLAALRTEIAKGDGDLRADMQKGINETHKWMIATVVGLFLGFGGLFLAMSNALKPTPTQAPQATTPAIIYLQPSAPQPAAPPTSK